MENYKLNLFLLVLHCLVLCTLWVFNFFINKFLLFTYWFLPQSFRFSRVVLGLEYMSLSHVRDPIYTVFTVGNSSSSLIWMCWDIWKNLINSFPNLLHWCIYHSKSSYFIIIYNLRFLANFIISMSVKLIHLGFNCMS